MYIILGRDNCSFCDKACKLLKSKDVPYLYINVKEPGMEHWVDYIKSNGLRTVPQVFKLEPGGYEKLVEDLNKKENENE